MLPSAGGIQRDKRTQKFGSRSNPSSLRHWQRGDCQLRGRSAGMAQGGHVVVARRPVAESRHTGVREPRRTPTYTARPHAVARSGTHVCVARMAVARRARPWRSRPDAPDARQRDKLGETGCDRVGRSVTCRLEPCLRPAARGRRASSARARPRSSLLDDVPRTRRENYTPDPPCFCVSDSRRQTRAPVFSACCTDHGSARARLCLSHQPA